MRSKEGASVPLVFVLIALLILLPVAYVLSDGPAMGLATRDYLPVGVYVTLYAPLFWAAHRSDRFAEVLGWYESWFCPPPLPSLSD